MCSMPCVQHPTPARLCRKQTVAISPLAHAITAAFAFMHSTQWCVIDVSSVLATWTGIPAPWPVGDPMQCRHCPTPQLQPVQDVGFFALCTPHLLGALQPGAPGSRGAAHTPAALARATHTHMHTHPSHGLQSKLACLFCRLAVLQLDNIIAGVLTGLGLSTWILLP